MQEWHFYCFPMTLNKKIKRASSQSENTRFIMEVEPSHADSKTQLPRNVNTRNWPAHKESA